MDLGRPAWRSCRAWRRRLARYGVRAGRATRCAVRARDAKAVVELPLAQSAIFGLRKAGSLSRGLYAGWGAYGGAEYDESSFPEFLYLEAFLDVRDAWLGRHVPQRLRALRDLWPGRDRRRPAPLPVQRRPDGHATIHPAPRGSWTRPCPRPSRPCCARLGGAIPYTPPPPPALTYPGPEQFFDEGLYVALNPDVAERLASGELRDATAHWREHGQAEGLRGARPSIVEDGWYAGMAAPDPGVPSDIAAFNAETYLLLYPDVLAALGPKPGYRADALAEPWRLEGRVGPGIAPYRDWQARPHRVLAKPFGVNVFGPFAATSPGWARRRANCCARCAAPACRWKSTPSTSPAPSRASPRPSAPAADLPAQPDPGQCRPDGAADGPLSGRHVR